MLTKKTDVFHINSMPNINYLVTSCPRCYFEYEIFIDNILNGMACYKCDLVFNIGIPDDIYSIIKDYNKVIGSIDARFSMSGDKIKLRYHDKKTNP